MNIKFILSCALFSTYAHSVVVSTHVLKNPETNKIVVLYGDLHAPSPENYHLIVAEYLAKADSQTEIITERFKHPGALQVGNLLAYLTQETKSTIFDPRAISTNLDSLVLSLSDSAINKILFPQISFDVFNQQIKPALAQFRNSELSIDDIIKSLIDATDMEKKEAINACTVFTNLRNFCDAQEIEQIEKAFSAYIIFLESWLTLFKSEHLTGLSSIEKDEKVTEFIKVYLHEHVAGSLCYDWNLIQHITCSSFKRTVCFGGAAHTFSIAHILNKMGYIILFSSHEDRRARSIDDADWINWVCTNGQLGATDQFKYIIQ